MYYCRTLDRTTLRLGRHILAFPREVRLTHGEFGSSHGFMRSADGPFGAARRLLIYRLGSLGDTAIALPAFHLLRRTFPQAEKRVLTNTPVSAMAPPIEDVLGDRFVDSFMAHPLALRAAAPILALRRTIAAWNPDLVVYLTGLRGQRRALRDAAFFRLCGVRTIVGLPIGARARHRGPSADGLWESEASRLARCLDTIGDARLNDPASWSLDFVPEERTEADRLLRGWAGANRFVVAAIGTKRSAKNWGEANWQTALASLCTSYANLGLAFVGAPGDWLTAQRLAGAWQGPVANLCGRTSPRVCALVIARARLFIGHDSGPMHLAASVGVPAVAVFSTLARPGVWFPHGPHHRVFYPGLRWSGGSPLVHREVHGETAIADILPHQVSAASASLLDATG
jgi:heptosyltransferase-3